MREESWKDLWHLPCLVKELQIASRKVFAKSEIASEKTPKNGLWAEKWNLMNPQGKEWNLLNLQNTQRSHRKQMFYFNDTVQFGAQIYSDAPSDENSGCENSSGYKNGRRSKQSQHGNWRKSRARRKSSWKHKTTKRKSTLQHGWTYRVFSLIRTLFPAHDQDFVA